MRLKKNLLLICSVIVFWTLPGCGQSTVKNNFINPPGKTVETRFSPPSGYNRIKADTTSFAAFLRRLPLKEQGAVVKLYNGDTKPNTNIYDAVVDLDIGGKNLHQCADAVMRLRADYLFQQKQYEKIHFNFTNGFAADYSKWRRGYKISVNGNDVRWKEYSRPLTSDQDYWEYLEMVFTYAGTLSLSKEMLSITAETMQAGDIFIQGGSPGHAIIVIDMAINASTGKKVFLLAQSYMPAQEIQILKNPEDKSLSPWYSLDFGNTLITPEWTFTNDDIKRFSE